MSKLFDRVKETSTTTGTGDFTLAGAISGCRTFNTAAGTFVNFHYVIENPADGTWETGVGQLTASTTLTRTTIITNSSGTTSAINFGAGTKYVYIDAPAASLVSQPGNTFHTSGCEPGGRLSLTSGTPVTTSDVAASSTVYYVSYKHNVCPIYDGTRWHENTILTPSLTCSPTSQTTRSCTVTNGSTTLTLTSGNTTGLYVGQLMTGTGVTATAQRIVSIDSSTTLTMNVAGSANVGSTVTFYACNYDIFAVDVLGNVALEALAWTDNTTRATALTTQDGRYVKSGDATRLYLGSFRMIHTTYTTDTTSQRFVWNMYNRLERQLYKVDNTSQWNYTTAAWRPANNSTANRVEILNGLNESPVTCHWYGGASSSSAASSLIGLALDSITSSTFYASIGSTYNYFTSTQAGGTLNCGLGYHYLQALEYGGTNCVFFGINMASSALIGYIVG